MSIYETGRADPVSSSAYEHPQPHACFIQSVEDDLVNENGIMDLWVREARLVQIRLRHWNELLVSCSEPERDGCPAEANRPAS